MFSLYIKIKFSIHFFLNFFPSVFEDGLHATKIESLAREATNMSYGMSTGKKNLNKPHENLETIQDMIAHCVIPNFNS